MKYRNTGGQKMLKKHKEKLKKFFAVFLSISTIMWSLGASLGALLFLAQPVMAAPPTVMFVNIEDSTNKILRVGFSEEVDLTTAETAGNYTLHIGQDEYTPDTAIKQGSPNSDVILDFTAVLTNAGVSITPGTEGDTLDISGVNNTSAETMAADSGRGIFAEMDTAGGFFGPDVIINEVVTNPQRDWNDTANGNGVAFDATYGDGNIDTADEYIELRINSAGVDTSADAASKYYLEIYNNDFSTKIGGITTNLEQYADPENTSGIFDTVRYITSGSGTKDSSEAGDFIVLGGLRGADLSDDVNISLFKGNGEFVNSVSFGAFDDGMVDDNAIACGGAVDTENSGRDNYGTDMGWNKGDFYQQEGTPGTENTYDPPLQLFGVFPMDATHLGLDFNEPPKQETIITSNFTITPAIVVSNAMIEPNGGGRFIKLTLASAQTSDVDYALTVGSGVTDQGGNPIELADRTRHFMGFGEDTTPPEITGINQPDPTRLEVYFNDKNGVDSSAASITVAETANSSNTINVSNFWSNFDMVSIDLDSQPAAGTEYTVTFTGIKDWPLPGGNANVLVTGNTISFTGRDFAGMDDGNPPFVLGTMPMDASSDVATNISKIQVSFSEKMDASTITESNIELYPYTVSSASRGTKVSPSSVFYDADLKTAIMELSGALDANQAYEIVVKSGVKDQSGTEFGYDFSSFFTTAGSDDTTPPNIFGTSIDEYWDAGESKYKDIPVGVGRISINFDSPLDPSSVMDSDASDAGSPIMLSTTSGGTTSYVHGDVEYDNFGWVADFKINNVLSANTEYTLTVAASVKDSAGNFLPAQFTRVFTTSGTDTTAPTIQHADSGGSSVFIKFSEPVQQTQAANLLNYTLYSDANADPTTEISLTSATAEYMLFDDAVEIRGLDLQPNDYFKIVVSGTIEDPSGNAISANSSFTSQIFQEGQWKDELHVWDNYPYGMQNDVPANIAALTARFSDALNSATVTTDTIKLYDDSDQSVAGTVSYKSDTNTVKFSPTASLNANARYRWKVGTDNPATSIKDINGNSLPFPFVVEFFTVSADSAAPAVSNINPADGETDVATALQVIEIFFSEGMDPSTINSGTIQIAKTSEIASGPYLSGTVDYDPFGFRAEFRPSSALVKNTEYTVRITTGVKDAAGNAIAQTDKTFTTINADDTSGPTVDWANADPYGLNIRFNEPVKEDLATATRNYTLITCAANEDLDDNGIAKSLTDKQINYQFWDNSIFIEDLNLTAGTKFRVTVSNVKDLADNSIQTGTDFSSETNFRKIETADLNYNQWEGMVFDPTFQDDSPWVVYNFPMPGDRNAPLNLQRVEIGFSEPIAISTLTSSTFQVMPVISPGVYGTALTATSISYDDSTNTAYFNLDPDNGTANVDKVVAGTEYRVVVTTGIQDSAGNAMKSFNPWNPNDTTAFENFFTVASSADTTAPEARGSSLEMYRNCSAGSDCPIQNVPVGLGAVDIKFSKPMDTNTIKDLNAGDSGSVIYIKKNSDDSKVSGSVEYDPFDQRATFMASEALVQNTEYTLVITSGVNGAKDIAGNQMSADYTLVFTTENSADADKPFIGQAEAESFEVRIFFNEPLKKTEAENINNYTLESPIGTDISLRGKSAIYDPMGNMVKISNLSLTGDNTFKITVQDVHDLANNAISISADNHINDDHIAAGIEFDPNSPRDINLDSNQDNTQFNQFEGYVMSHFAGFFGGKDKSDYTHEEKMFDHFAGNADVFPQMAMAGQISTYFINFPIRTAIPSGGSIVVQFPEGYNVSNAAAVPVFDPANPSPNQSPMNGDINGPNTGEITIASVSANSISRTITVITAGASTQTNDFISVDISGIVNPSTPKDFGTQGYTATITTKGIDGKTLEGPIESQPIFITPKGTSAISGTITATGADDSESFIVRLGTPNGMIEQTVIINDDKVNGSSGAALLEDAGQAKYSFANLPSGDFDVYVDPIITLSKGGVNTDYFAPNFHEMIHLNSEEAKTYDFSLSDSTDTTYTNNWGDVLNMHSLTVNITGGPASKKVMIHAGGPMNFYEKEVLLDSSGDGSVSINVPEGMYWVNVDPYMPLMMFSAGSPPAPDFVSPPGKDVNVNNSQDGSETAADTVDFSLSNYTANKYLEVTIQDTTGVTLNNVDVGVHNPNKGFGVPPVRTGQNGKAVIKVPAGTYQVDVNIPGMPPLPPESVTITDSNTIGDPATLTVQVSFDTDSMIEITGQVVNGTSTVPYAPVWADEINSDGTQYLPGFIPGGTDSNGNFSFFVPSGTNWELKASISGIGDTNSVKLYNITASPPSQTLSARTDLVAITGTIKLNGTAVQHANIFAEGTGATSFFNGTDTENDGSYTLYVEAGTYKIKAFSPEYGEKIVSESVDVSDGNDKSLGITDLSSGSDLVSVVINFKDSAGNAMTVERAFVDIFNTSTGEGNKKDFSGVSTGTIKIPAGAYSVNGFIKGIGPIAPQTLNTNETQTLDIQASSATVIISGTVTDGSDNIEGVFVDVFCPSTGFKESARTASDGVYSVTVPANQTYNIITNKQGYQPIPPMEVTVAEADSSGNNITLIHVDENKKITGSVYLGTAVAANLSNNTTKKAFVWAETDNGEWIGVPVEADGTYTLYVKSGTWKVRAAADGYETAAAEVKTITIANSASTGQDFALTAITGYTAQQASGSSFTPTSTGRASSPDNKARVIAPAQSIKVDANNGDVTMQIKPTTRAPKKTDIIAADNDGTVSVTPAITPITTKAQEVTAEDTSGQISTLANSINIEFDYSDYDSDVVAAIETNPDLLTCQYLNEANQWETTEAVSNDTTNHILTCTTSHLSVYAPSLPSNILAPAAPTGSSVSAGNNSVTIVWNKNSESDMDHYIIWESEVNEAEVATVSQSTCGASTCEYTHSGLSSGTTYGYQIMAVDNDGYTSAGSAVKTVTVAASSSPPASSGGSVYVAPQPEEQTETEQQEETSEDQTDQQQEEVPQIIETPSSAKLPYKNGSLLKVKGNPTIWLIEDSLRYGIPSGGIFESRFRWQDIVEILSSSTLEQYAEGTNLKYPDGTLIMGSDKTVYAVSDNGKKRGFTSPDIFTGLGYKWENIVAISDAELQTYATGAIISSADRHPTGALLNINGTIFQISSNNQLRGIPTPNIFNANHFDWDSITIATQQDKALPIGANLLFPDGTLIREKNEKTVYLVSDQIKYGFTSPAAFTSRGYKWENIIEVSKEEINLLKDGETI